MDEREAVATAPSDVLARRFVVPDRAVLVAWFVSRVFAAFGLVMGTWWRTGRPGSGGFFAWDGQWYLRAGVVGYGTAPLAGRQSPWPFFPLLPGLLRVLHGIDLPASLVLIVGNHLIILAGLIGVWHLANRHFGGDVARLSVWVMAVFPMSGVFSMLYPSAIFVAASAWAFELAERRRWGLCGLMAGVATVARPNGVFIAVVVVVVATSTVPRLLRSAVTAMVAGPSALAVAVWMAVCAYKTGNPIVFATAKSAWKERTILALARYVRYGVKLDPVLLVHVGLGAIAATALWATWDQLPRSWRWLGVTALVVPMVTGLVGLGRYSTECFSLAIAGGAALANASPRTQRLAIVASTATGFAATVAMAAHGLVP